MTQSTLQPDFAEMLEAFDAEQADYIVVGAYAVAAHGHPRATGDLDIFVRPSRANADRVWRALLRFGAPLFDLTLDDLATPGVVFQMGLPPVRIDLLTAIDGVSFDDAWASHMVVERDDLRIPVLGRETLLRNKRASGRPKDLADVAALEGLAGDEA